MLKSRLISKLTSEIYDFLKQRTDAFTIGKEGIRENDTLPPNVSLYELYDEHNMDASIGFILLDKDTPYGNLDTEYEIILGIFDEYRKKDYGSKCINNLVTLLPNENWNNVTIKATVKKTNEDRNFIIKILNAIYTKHFHKTKNKCEKYEDDVLVEYRISANLFG